jgi:hypothetical protein
VIALPHDCAAHEVPFLAVPDHLGAADPAKGSQSGNEVDRLEDVRLALGVVAQQQVKSRRETDIQPRVIAEIPEAQMGQMHRPRMSRKAGTREKFFPERFLIRIRCATRGILRGDG